MHDRASQGRADTPRRLALGWRVWCGSAGLAGALAGCLGRGPAAGEAPDLPPYRRQGAVLAVAGSLHPASYWEELQPMESRVFGERLNLLEQIVYLNTGERGYQELYKTLSAKLGKNEISYTKFLEEMNARRKELDENNEMAKVCGKPVKDVALTFGPKQTAWENGRHGAFWALLFSLGLFSCRPYLPRGIGWVALFYLLAGGGLLLLGVALFSRRDL